MSTVISKPGTLYIVATPIGNLGDITLRAREILDEVDLIAAEDTRNSAKLLNALGISTPMMALHEHNEMAQAVVIKEKIESGQQIALISDAGTPLISDPGHKLVDLIYQSDLKIVPIPGPSSVLTALCVSGISAASFKFIGFLPSKASQRRLCLAQLKNSDSSVVLFESPHRIVDSIADMVTILGEDRQASFCRELTKKFETIIKGRLIDLKNSIDTNPDHSRGEIVIVIEGVDKADQDEDENDYSQLVSGMLEFMPTKAVASLLAKHTGRSRRYFYDMALKIRSDS